MNIVLLGPPGSGKGTQAAFIASAFAMPHVSTGDMFRVTQREDSPLGTRLRSQMGSGKLIPDGLVNEIVERRLRDEDCKRGFLLDGYPRTVPQAQALEEILRRTDRSLDHVLLLTAPDEVLLDRIIGRRQDPETGNIYHLVHYPPPTNVAGRVILRADDTEEVLRERLEEYHEKTAALIPHYHQRGLLRVLDGTLPSSEVQANIQDILRHPPTL